MSTTLVTIPTTFPQSPQYGPRSDYLHIINYGDPDTEFLALETGEIDIAGDWPLSAYWINKWVGEGRIPSEITIDPIAEIGSYEYDIYNQKWPTGCDGVAAREGYPEGHRHTRQRPDKDTYVGDHPPTYDPVTQTTPMGDGADYDPSTGSWKVYYDPECPWCQMAWGLRLAIAFITDKDYVDSVILEGLGARMVAWAANPAHMGYLDIANLTLSSFVYSGPEGDVTIPSLIFGYGMTRAEMDAKAVELLEAAGFKDWDGDGTRNDPRKVAGADKAYGTADDDKTSASNMDELLFYIRLDDPDREAAGLKLAADLEEFDVPVNAKDIEKTVCFKIVMVEYNYHLYTGGYSYGADPWEIQKGLWHSDQYWYPVGWAGGYQGFCHVLNDEYTYIVQNSPDFNAIVDAMKKSTYIQNKYVNSIPLWSAASAEGYRTGWEGVINTAGYHLMYGTGGIYYWTLFNMYKADDNTIDAGFKANAEELSVVSSEWVWDWIVLDAIYETLAVRNPHNLAKDRGMLAESWTTGTWDTDKIYVDFKLKDGVKWHDGTLLTAEDVEWGLEFIRDCGPGIAWNQMAVQDVEDIEVLTPGPGGEVRIKYSTGSFWAVHLAGFTEFPSRKIWMAANEAFGWGYDPTKPPGYGPGLRFPDHDHALMVREYKPWKMEHDVYDASIQGYNPDGDGILDLAQDGTGPWVWVGSDPLMQEYYDLEAFRDHHISQEEASNYLAFAFHETGNVNYLGSAHEADYIAAGLGTDRVIDEADMILMEKSLFTTSADPAGTGWDEWNEDADVNGDASVDDLDYAIAGFNYGSSAG